MCRGGLVVVCSAVACLAPVGTAVSGSPNLDKLVFRAGQVSPGYKLETLPDGRCVRGCVTLDLCAFTFPSEELRTARLQVDYVRKGAPGVSNEVVSYQPGGAKQALREITHAANDCPTGPVGSPIAGLKVTYRIRRISDPRLLPGYLAVRVHISGKVNGRQREVTAIGIYQARGDIFTGVYTNGSGSITSQQRIGLHAAEESVKNLKHLG
jgi:hypothetical protein